MVLSKITCVGLIGLVLFLPIQNIYADFWSSQFDQIKDSTEKFVQSVGVYSQEEFEKNIPKYISAFHNNELSNEMIFYIISSLEFFKNTSPEIFSNWLVDYPQINKITDHYFENEIQIQLQKMPSEWNELGFDVALVNITENIDEFGQRNMRLAHATEMDVDGFAKPQGFVNESIILGSKSVLIFDFEAKKVVTLDQFARKMIENEPGLVNTDFAKDPIRAGLLLFFDGEYLYVAPLIPVQNNQFISLAQFCQLQIDEDKCEKAKIFLKTASYASKAKDPTLFLHSANAFLGIIHEINNEFELGIDTEINYAKSILSITPNNLANVKILERDGNLISINQASEIQFHEKKINLAQILLHELEKPELNDQQRLENIILVLEIIDEINEQ